jgi:hypothetical protein
MKVLHAALCVTHLAPGLSLAVALPVLGSFTSGQADTLTSANFVLSRDSKVVTGGSMAYLRTRKEKGIPGASAEENKTDEVEITGAFGTPVALVGGNKKQDALFKSVSPSQ